MPEQNGIAERTDRTIMECARAMLSHSGLPSCFWAEAVQKASEIRNRFFCPVSSTTTTYQVMTGVKPRVDHFRTFGCLAWMHVAKEKRKKLDWKSEKRY